MSMISNEFYEFGPFRLDVEERTLVRDGSSLPMTPKLFDTLLYMVRNPGRILTKDELIEVIWPGTFVEEVNLAVNVSNLRKLLGDSRQEANYIETVSGRGYRFNAQVVSGQIREKGQTGSEFQKADVETTELEMPPSLQGETIAVPQAAGSVPVRLRWRRWLVLAATLLVIAAAGLSLWLRYRKPASSKGTSIAVLPFADLSPEKNQEYFSDGLADELTNDLAKTPGLRVIARSSAFQFKGTNVDLHTIARTLGVANVLEGSVRRDKDRVRITVALIKVDDGFQLWSETYDRKVDDVFAVQEEIASAVTGALQVRILSPGNSAASPRFRNPAAYEPYLQARYFLARGEDREDLEKAQSYVNHSIELDPGFAPSWALRSTVILTQSTIGWRNHEEGARLGRSDAEKAIALDPASAPGYIALGWEKISYEWDWDGADRLLLKAGELEPGNAVVLSYRAYLYECQARLDEAIALTEEAGKIDPLRTNAFLGELLYFAGRYDESKAASEKALAMNPHLEGIHFRIGLVLLAQGRVEDALGQAESEPGEWQRATLQGLAYHALHRETDSDSALSMLIATHAEDSPYQIAEIYGFRGQADKSFEWLERAYRLRDPGLNQLKVDPLLTGVRTDPRYRAMLQRLRLDSSRS